MENEEVIKIRYIGERKPNISLLSLFMDNEKNEIDLGEDCSIDDFNYTCGFLNDIRFTFYLTTHSYQLLKKLLFKQIYCLSKTIQNIDDDNKVNNEYSERILEIIKSHKFFYKECLKNPNLYSIPFVYGIELLFRRFGYQYKLPSGQLSFDNFIKFEMTIRKINLFLKYSGATHGRIGGGLIFRICISIIENINVNYALGGDQTVNTNVRYNAVKSCFGINKIIRKYIKNDYIKKNLIKSKKRKREELS